MKTTKTLIALAAVAIAMSSCVSKQKYAQLQSDYTTLQGNYSALQGDYKTLQGDYQSTRESLIESNAEGRNLQNQLDAAIKQNEGLKSGLSSLKGTLDQSMNQNLQSSTNIAKLLDEVNASNKYIKQLVDAKSKSDSLNIALTNKLTRSLTTSELKDVDVKVLKGVVYISLADNMLFKSGSYEISSAARETLDKIAKIIKDYSDYDVLVEGNTDNVPISKTNIRNNWDLSALRASSVVQYLQDECGINPSRLSAAGRGEYNPITDNDSDLGRSRNRRTEIIITPKLDQFLDLIDQAPTDSQQ